VQHSPKREREEGAGAIAFSLSVYVMPWVILPHPGTARLVKTSIRIQAIHPSQKFRRNRVVCEEANAAASMRSRSLCVLNMHSRRRAHRETMRRSCRHRKPRARPADVHLGKSNEKLNRRRGNGWATPENSDSPSSDVPMECQSEPPNRATRDKQARWRAPERAPWGQFVRM